MGSASSLMFEIADYMPREFVFSIIIAFSAIVAALLLGAWLGNQIPASEAEKMVTNLDEEIKDLTSQTFFMRSLAIFTHNLLLSLLTFAPFAGLGWMLFVTYNTGLFFGGFRPDASWRPCTPSPSNSACCFQLSRSACRSLRVWCVYSPLR